MSRGDLLSLERKKAQMYETWQNSEAAYVFEWLLLLRVPLSLTSSC